MAKVLVTGSAGFIGYYIAKALLEKGDDVIGVDNLNPYYSVKLKEDRNKILKGFSNYSFYQVDLQNKDKLYECLDKEQPKIICHLGAQAGVRYSFENPFIYEQSNILGFLNLLEWARKDCDNFVFASSSSVYGGNTIVPFSESDRVDTPISFYAATKKSNELMAHVYHHLFGIPITGLRFFTVYGPWDRPDMALSKFVTRVTRMNNEEAIDVYGNGKMKRDFTFVEDIIPPVLNALDTPRKYDIYNLGGNKPVELMYFVSLIEKELGVTAEKNMKPMQPGDVKDTFANIEKAKRDLGFDPKTTIEAGIKKYVKWFKSYHKDIK
jgi:UDP-glucuronate 4-epimerase